MSPESFGDMPDSWLSPDFHVSFFLEGDALRSLPRVKSLGWDRQRFALYGQESVVSSKKGLIRIREITPLANEPIFDQKEEEIVPLAEAEGNELVGILETTDRVPTSKEVLEFVNRAGVEPGIREQIMEGKKPFVTIFLTPARDGADHLHVFRLALRSGAIVAETVTPHLHA